MPKYVHDTPFIIEPEDNFLEKFPHLRQSSRYLAMRYAHRELVTDEHLTAIGSKLWKALDIDDRFEQAQGKCGTAILPIVIKSKSAAVQSLPWETLCHPKYGFLGKEARFTLSRQFTDANSPAPLEKGPLRILLFTSLPDDLNPETDRLNVEEEQAQMQEALMPWIGEGLVDLKMPDDGRFSTLKALLKSYEPHLLFLSGHGHFKDGKLRETDSYGEFVFESEKGKSAPVRDEDIAAAFIGSNIQGVILSACESSKASSDALTDGLSQKLSLRGIPHVIGMRESVFDEAGIQFAQALSAAFAEGERIDVALQEARLAIEKPFEDEGASRRAGALNPNAELGYGQWSLPMLISGMPDRALIDWNFEKESKKKTITSKTLESISLPPRFIGRRTEMRNYKSQLFDGKLKNLLITGAGGQGKTSLAGKLAQDLQADGYRVFAWSARMENSWAQFEFQMELALGEMGADYDRVRTRFSTDAERIRHFLDLLNQRFVNKVVFFLDNLESLQDPDSLSLKDEKVTLWIEALQANDQIILLATSRWALPNWEGEQLSLTRASYGDFLQMAQGLAARGNLPKEFLARERLREVYEALGGNGRGLDFFAAALKLLNDQEAESNFLKTLIDAQDEIKADMAIATIYAHLPPAEQALLQRLPLYHHPVPLEGIQKVGEGLAAKEALQRLMAVSLVEVYEESQWQALQYQISPLVAEWLSEKDLIDKNPSWRNLVADYQLFLFEQERPNLTQAIILHAALERAKRQEEADRLALDRIVGALNRTGLHQSILQHWLPLIAKSKDQKTRAEGLEQMGKQNLHLGNFTQAMPYFQKSLAIQEEIGDKAGKGNTLNNISAIYQAQGDYATALDYLKKSLAIRQKIGDKAGEGITLNNIATAYQAQGDYETTLDYLKKSLAIRQEISDKAGEGTTLNNIATVYQAQGDYMTALDYLKKSLAIIQEIGDKKNEGGALNNIAAVYKAQGDYATALDYLKKSLAIQEEIGNKAGEGAALSNISGIFQVQGDYATTLGYLKKSLAIQEEIGNKASEGTALNNIATVYQAQGDYATALDYLKKSLAIQEEIGNIQGESVAFNNISNIYREWGRYDEALEYSKRDLAICQKIGDKAGEGTALNTISQIYDAQDDYATALDYLKKSLAIRQEIGDKAGEGATLFNIGHIYAQNNEMQEALGAWVSVYRIATVINQHQALQALANLAPQLGLPEGLAGWDDLAKRIDAGKEISFGNTEQKENTAESEREQLAQFIQAVIKVAKENAPEAKQYFDDMSQLAGNEKAPVELRELGKVLQRVLMGEKSPELSGLPEEMQEIVQEALKE